MALDLMIGQERLSIAAPRFALEAVRRRYGAFEIEAPPRRGAGPAPIRLRVQSRLSGFSPHYERPCEVVTRLSSRDEVVFEGGARGCYAAAGRCGVVYDAGGVGAVDVLVRTALSVALPLSGALLMHGAALTLGTTDGLALCGASGTGKSTAATAFGASSDEMLVLRPTEEGLEIAGTPYWAGRPLRRTCRDVVCLERGNSVPGVRGLRGGSIVRVLSRHLIRHVAIPRVDSAIISLLGAVATRARVRIASCPEGAAFLPFLEDHLGVRARSTGASLAQEAIRDRA